MSGMTTERLAEIRERADAATPGPWGHWNPTGTQNHAVCTNEGDIATDNEGVWYSEADAEFIAHARTDVPDLTEQIDHLTADNARLREGIAEALDLARLLPEQLECGGNSCHCTACDLVCELGNLLNPPTEGEADAVHQDYCAFAGQPLSVHGALPWPAAPGEEMCACQPRGVLPKIGVPVPARPRDVPAYLRKMGLRVCEIPDCGCNGYEHP